MAFLFFILLVVATTNGDWSHGSYKGASGASYEGISFKSGLWRLCVTVVPAAFLTAKPITTCASSESMRALCVLCTCPCGRGSSVNRCVRAISSCSLQVDAHHSGDDPGPRREAAERQCEVRLLRAAVLQCLPLV
jgi:hypothetical protein